METTPGSSGAPLLKASRAETPDPGRLAQLVPFAPVALRLLRLFDADDAEQAGISRLVEADPALTAEILSIVNSALYPIRGKITSPAHGVAMLGLDMIKALTTTLAMRAMLSGSPRIDIVRRFWRHSIGSAAIAHELAPWFGVDTGLAYVAAVVHDIGRTEVREAEEYFARGQKGSSAMPHKRNPVTCEQICGLARVVRADVQAAFENVALWHERDISHSSVERVILPDSTILADYLLDKTTKLVDQLLVYPERMRRNLEMTRGLVFSGQVLLDLAAAGMLREPAYRIVQSHAMRAWETEGDFRAAIENDPEIRAVLSRERIAEAFSLERQLRNVDKIFQRVFGEEAGRV